MGSRVYIGRLSSQCREKDLEKFFKGYGKINEVILKRGFGFVDFEDIRNAYDAVYELNGRNLLGERVVLEIARSPSRKSGRNMYQKIYGPPIRTDYRLLVDNLSSKVSWQLDCVSHKRDAKEEVTFASLR
ncbi:hypothetical protein CEXT_659861 [Caerostris extrusa]|uniref:RRM domain-containing protein n=1 Tax=Caerostris extrusa TaxID=172846 RepID=A0AAV4MAZ8_CAEEX|nr:hypothetical protein CEXT_659861 [Caerostris extrusa]